MKRVTALLLALVIVMTLVACGGQQVQPDTPPQSQNQSGPDQSESGPEGPVEPEAPPAHYRDTMVVYDELEPVDHLVILQNALKFSRDGFYTAETAPATQEIAYNNGEMVSAYTMRDVLVMLNNTCEGDLTIVTLDEQESAMTAEDFSALYVIIDDFGSGNPPVLYDPSTGTEVTDFWYALTAEGEAIFSVISGHSYPLTDLLAIAGWDTKAGYTICATDKFHIPVTGEYVGIGEIRGTLSGSVNGSFGDLPIASGKISDVVIIQPLQEG